MTPKYKITLRLVGLDGNAFYLMGAFSRRAKKEGWSKEEIDGVLSEARTRDYNHLLAIHPGWTLSSGRPDRWGATDGVRDVAALAA